MAEYYITLPEMGESVAEATITNWLKNEGDFVKKEEPIVEISTDKIDSEIFSPVNGILKKKMFLKNEISKVGEIIAIIEINSENKILNQDYSLKEDTLKKVTKQNNSIIKKSSKYLEENSLINNNSYKFYSPLVRSIARKENISYYELSKIKGKGKNGRVVKEDLQNYLLNRSKKKNNKISQSHKILKNKSSFSESEVEIIKMDRIRKIIAKNMIDSQSISAHVTSFIEADMTRIVQWREKIKNNFKKRTGEKLTFMPFFVKSVVKSIKDFPLINSIIEGDFIIKKKKIHIGIATDLLNGNLIVPVIKNAENYNIIDLSKIINDLANRARKNFLKPDEIQGGTYTITNMGSFGTLLGTPIINQPQLSILGIGVIHKKPSIIETPQGDVIGIRNKIFLSHSYDHRVIDGALGGNFVKRVAYYLENFDFDNE